MEAMRISIRQEETGKRIRTLMRDRGFSARDVQEFMGFESDRAVYKWMAGKSLPSLENLLILSRLLHTDIESILVTDGDALCIMITGGNLWYQPQRTSCAGW